MANENKISQIQVGSVTYDIHDAAALPSNADNNYALAIKDQSNDSNILTAGWDGTVVTGGDFMTVDPRLDSTASSLAGYTYRAWSIRDANDRTVMYLQAAESAAGMVLTTIAARRVVNGENVDNRLDLRVAADGTRSVVVSDQKSWRAGLGLDLHTSTVTLSGCTVSGQCCWHNGVTCSITMLDVKLNTALANGRSVVFGTIPSGYRPSQTIYDLASSSNATFCGRLVFNIYANGQLGIVNRSGSNLPANTPFSLFVTYAI